MAAGNKIKVWVPPTTAKKNDLPAWKLLMQDVHDNMLDMGMLQTDDSGQIVSFDDFTSLPANGSYGGYKIYEVNDQLSATHPIFIKLEFGLGQEGLGDQGSWGNGYFPNIRISTSTDTNGEGTLTGQVSRAVGCPQEIYASTWNGPDNTTLGLSHYSRREDYGFFGMVYGAGSRNNPMTSSWGGYIGATLSFFIERVGVDGFAVLLPDLKLTRIDGLWDTGVLPVSICQYIPYSGSSSVAAKDMATRLFGISYTNNAGRIQLQPVFIPVTLSQWKGIATYKEGDIATNAQFSLEMEPANPKTFVALGKETCLSVDGLVGQRAAFAMVFDNE